jgi:hypothetical protein
MSAGWLRIAICIIVMGGAVLAHEEPPKSHEDLENQRLTTERIRQAGVRTELQHKIVFKADGSERYQYLAAGNIYDRDGNLRRGSIYDSNGSEIVSVEFVYDLERELQEQNECVKDSGCERSVFLYRSDHLVALALDLDKDGNPKARLQYAYQLGDTVVHLTKRNAAESLLYTIDYCYFPDRQTGHMVRAIKKDPAGKLELRTEQSWDSTGLKEKKIYGADDKLMVRYEYVRRPDGQLLSFKRYAPTGDCTQQMIWEYGANDLPLRHTTSDGAGHRSYTLEYEYENW